MKTKSYSALKSGSDIRGVAIQTADTDITLTIEAVYDISGAFFKWLSEKCGKQELTVAVGYDVRLSCPAILQAIQQTAISCGCKIINCGMSTTPSMFLLLKEEGWNCDASIMITASHLPYERNGLKFFTPEGGLEGSDITEILQMAEKSQKLPAASGSSEDRPFMDEYIRKLVTLVRSATGKTAPLFGKRIIVDASNGVGGFFAKRVLQQLGAITDGSINLEPDGNFPAHAPNPENPEAIRALSEVVLASRADLGIIFDTDVDRAALVDGNGRPINRDSLIALTATTILSEKQATIVTDSVTCDGLTDFIESYGGKHVRFKRGYKNVINEAKRRNAEGEYCPLAIETSGHAAFLDNYFLDDGAYLVCKLLVAYAAQSQKREKLSDLISTLNLPVEENEVRVSFNENSVNFRLEGQRVMTELKHFAQFDKNVWVSQNCYEGVRLNYANGYGDGWTLVRLSVHDPVLPINFASNAEGGNLKMAKDLFYILDKYPFLDVTNLRNFIRRKS